MSGCEACDALRKVAPRIMCHMTTKDDILCGYHASELKKELDEIRFSRVEDGLCMRWINVWEGIRGRCKMAESWVGHHDPKNPYFHTFFSGRR